MPSAHHITTGTQDFQTFLRLCISIVPKLLATGIISKLAQQETPFIASQMCLPDTKVTS